jgi:hypothetical protein
MVVSDFFTKIAHYISPAQRPTPRRLGSCPRGKKRYVTGCLGEKVPLLAGNGLFFTKKADPLGSACPALPPYAIRTFL